VVGVGVIIVLSSPSVKLWTCEVGRCIVPVVEFLGASEAVLDQGIGSGEGDNLLTGFAFLLNHLFHMYIVPDPLEDVKGLGGVLPKLFVLTVEQSEDVLWVAVTVGGEEGVDH